MDDDRARGEPLREEPPEASGERQLRALAYDELHRLARKAMA